MRFSDIIGHTDIIEKLLGAVSAGRIPHAQLLYGPEGNQKLPLAIAYAQYINCRNKLSKADLEREFSNSEYLPSADSCGKCPSCIKYGVLAHPDLYFFYPNNTGNVVKKDSQSGDYLHLWRELFLETNGEFSYNDCLNKFELGNKQANINVRDCNSILKILSLKSYEADYRVIVIWMVEHLREANASILLKTLEEPTLGTVFLLLSENRELILETILSRSQLVSLGQLGSTQIKKALINKYGANEDIAKMAAIQSGGNLVEARAMLNVSERNDDYHNYFVTWMRICYKADMPSIIEFCENISSLGRENLKFFLIECLNKVEACLLIRNGSSEHLRLINEEKTFLQNFSKYINNNNIKRFYTLFNDAVYSIQRNAHLSNLIMDMSLQFCYTLNEAKKNS